MCTGIEIAVLAAGAAAAAGGTAIERHDAAKNAERNQRARNDVLRETTLRARAFEDKNRQEGVGKALKRFSAETQQAALEAAQQQREGAIAETVTQAPGVESIPLEGAPEIIKGNIGQRLRDVFNTATAHAKLAAKPLTWNDTLMGNNVALTEAGRLIDTNNSFAKQEMAMLPSQQEFAGFAAQKDPSVWGPILKIAGQTAMAGAGGGYFAGRAAANAAANAAAPTLLTMMPTSI